MMPDQAYVYGIIYEAQSEILENVEVCILVDDES